MLTELVTNGVIHDGGDDIVIEADASERHLHVEVISAAAPADRAVDIREDVADIRENVAPAETGRGLSIVSSVCDMVDIRETESGRRTVACAMTLEPQAHSGGWSVSQERRQTHGGIGPS